MTRINVVPVEELSNKGFSYKGVDRCRSGSYSSSQVSNKIKEKDE